MDRRLRNALILLVVIGVGAWLSRHCGWYNTYWFTDVALHTLSGVMFAYFWAFFVRKEHFSSSWIYIISAVSFAVFGSVIWEVWEFYGHLLKPDETQFYVPELEDSLQDIVSGMTGALLSAVRSRMK